VSILIDNETRLLVQGLTGREGTFHAGRNRDYGTNVVAGVTPGKGGTDVNEIPVFDTVADAVEESKANTSMIFVPARFAADAVLEAYESGLDVIVAITEGIPAMDMARAVPYIRAGDRDTTLIGPNCPGLISPGKANVGIIPGEICEPGPVGLVSRSGTLTYQIIHELTQRGIGQSTCVGIGGDPIPGSDFIDILAKFEADDETELVVLVGEIGGDAEERAAAWAKDNMSKPVVAYIAGFTAPPGKRMGHAGAIISGSRGTAQAKADALEGAGIRVGRNPTQVAELVQELHEG
jgi:succinyl-CoA synthetase alpha subunit